MLLLSWAPAKAVDAPGGEFMIRVGAVYDPWKSEAFVLAPAIYADIFHDEVKWVLGFNFAWGF